MERSRGEWLADIAVMGIAALLGGLYILTALTVASRPVSWSYELIHGGAALVGLLLFRRRWPAELVLGLLVPAILSLIASGAAAVALFNLAVKRSWRISIPLGALLTAVVTGMYTAAARATPEYVPAVGDYWKTVVFIVVLHAAVIALGMHFRSQQVLVEAAWEQVREAAERQRMLAEDARRRERERLAREMHVALERRLSLLAAQAEGIEFGRDGSAEGINVTEVIRQGARDALSDLRQVVRILRGGSGEPYPGLADIPALIAESRQAGVMVSLDLDDQLDLYRGIGRHVYRIVQEGLTNARKHAPGSSVLVTVRPDGDGVAVEVVNSPGDGSVDGEVPGAGAGLIGLRERLHLVGGRLKHGQTSDVGYSLEAWLPR